MDIRDNKILISGLRGERKNVKSLLCPWFRWSTNSFSCPLRPCGSGRGLASASCATTDGPQASGGRVGGCPRSLGTTPDGTPASGLARRTLHE